MASYLHINEMEVTIEALSLQEFYPEKITRNILYEITELSMLDDEEVTQQNIAWHFLNNLTRLNYNARNIKLTNTEPQEKPLGYLQRRKLEKKQNAISFHPLDIIIAVYTCCDPIAKQDFVKHLWDCKLAIPFLLQTDKSKEPRLFVWPMRSLIAQWQTENDELPQECQIYQLPMKHIGVLRMGELEESKSALINGIIFGPEKTHPMFFHRDLPSSKENRSDIVNGLIELGWFFPKGTDDDYFKKCICLFNLRGDAYHSNYQKQFLCENMHVLIILSHTKYFESIQSDLQKMIKNTKGNVILVLTDLTLTDKEFELIDKTVDYFGIQCINDKFEILTFEKMRQAEKNELLTKQIKKMLDIDLRSLSQICEGLDLNNIYIDEKHCSGTKIGVKRSTDILKFIAEIKSSDRKQTIAPLQGEMWKKWTRDEIEIHRLEDFSKNGNDDGITIGDYRHKLEERKLLYRQKQVECIKSSFSVIMQMFIEFFCELNDVQRQIFLRTFKQGLDEISKTSMLPYYIEYKTILTQLGCVDKDKNKVLVDSLEKLDEKKTNEAFGLEHFVREIGQIFEAYWSTQDDSDYSINLLGSKSIRVSSLPYIAALLLTYGYPIEIMDGDVAFVPEVWIEHVLEEIRSVLHDIERKEVIVHVISVLGIQSSGKSTLLNTIFGLQFAVSAGRCTKGVFMQMIKVSVKLRETIKCDYLIVIDTEGLRAAQLSSDLLFKFDNELSCFSIGLADLTIINLMGENATYLQENLPIVVHAFLRMDMAGLSPRCSIVHHNVDKRNKGKLMEQNFLLEKVLNDLTEKACKLENEAPKRFRDIIEFEIDKDTDYIPSLFEGEQPMAAISVGYYKESVELRKKMIRRINTFSRQMNINTFSKNLRNLWSAIKSDQFVFEFKSTIETEEMIKLDELYCDVEHSIFKIGSDLEDTTISLIQLNRNKTKETIKEKLSIDTISRDFDNKVEEKRSGFIESIKNKTKSKPHWINKMLAKFDRIVHDSRKDCLDGYKAMIKHEFSSDESYTIDTVSEYQDGISRSDIEKLNSIISIVLEKNPNYRSTDKLVCYIWKEWCDYIIKRRLMTGDGELKFQQIKSDAETVLYDAMSDVKHLLDRQLKKVPLEGHSFTNFEVEWRHVFMDGTQPTSKFRNFYSPIKEDLETLLKIISNNIDLKLKTFRERKTSYSISKVKAIVNIMNHKIKSGKKKMTKDFKVDLSIAVTNYAVTSLSEIYGAEMQRVNIQAQLDKSKKIYFVTIRARLDDETNEHVSNHIVDFMFNSICSQAFNDLVKYALVIKPYDTLSKRKIIREMLISTVKTQNLELIQVYRADPKSAVIAYIENEIKVEHFEQYYKSIINQIFHTCSGICKRTVDIGKTSFSSWISSVYRKANMKSSLHIPLINVKHEQKVILKIARLFENSSENLLELADTFFKNKNNVSLFRQAVASVIVEKHFGCLESCPFCSEICMYSNKNHEWKHEAILHRPIAIKSYRDRETGIFGLMNCEDLVSSDCTVLVEDTYIPFKEYHKAHPDWKIRSNPSTDSSLFWKWYIANHFADKSGILQVPKTWRSIQKRQVLHSLANESMTADLRSLSLNIVETLRTKLRPKDVASKTS